jgi:hypothetical protein
VRKTTTIEATVRGIRSALITVALAWPILASTRGASQLATAGTPDPNASVRPAPFAPLSRAGRSQGPNFFGEIVSTDARRVADWAIASRDNDGLPFVIIDKIRAKVFVFDNVGRLRGATFALLGRAHGDDTVAGIGNRKLSAIRPEERTTPAGRFVAALGHDFKQDILWIDYGNSISLHRVITGDPGDHRFQRLATPSPLDKRISYGCINVPVEFYEQIVVKTFTGTNGIVYILPETKTIEDVFPISGSADSAIANETSGR